MKKTGYIWRESVYKNGFKCSCGRLLMKDGKPINVIASHAIGDDSDDTYLFCIGCNKSVALIKEVEVPDDTDRQMMGDYNEFMKGRRS